VTLLFVHGAGCTGEVFQAQRQAFPAAHAPDLPGHLCAGSPAGIEEFADAVEAYARDRELRGVTLVGHSMGGAIAIESALRKPRWLSSVVLLGAGARMRVAPAFLEGLANDFDSTVRRLAGLFFSDPTADRVQAAVEMMHRVGQAQTLRDFQACDAFDALERIGSISVPLLAITGEADVMTPAKFARLLADRVPEAQARILPGAGHFVMAELPLETNAAIAAFLRGSEVP
jgi:pimeloyl-ACP methyl ester carboxylesterase